ncbi:MAG: response regulator [Elusimicrobia bacterium]|nr:response regulator [Elusimicrobiota bacterium]
MATRVLAIDDEEDYRVILRDVLGEAGFEVRLAVDGSEGLAALKQFKPDVILCDWMMPKLDGQAFVSQLRSDPAYKSVPVIMLTVKQTSDDELEALHFGVDDFIVKPFQSEDLLARIRAVLRRTKV